MKRFEQMQIYHDLFWAAKTQRGFDNLFHSPGFMDKFSEFQKSEFYERWVKTEEYLKYRKWQSS